MKVESMTRVNKAFLKCDALKVMRVKMQRVAEIKKTLAILFKYN